MANSSIIGKTKSKIIKEFIKSDAIINAINSPDVTNPEELLNTHIFNFHQNPYTIGKVITFVTVQVHIPTTVDSNATFVKPTIEIWIISHFKHMVVDNVPKITQNRNDYLAELIDNMLNGRGDIGLGNLHLITNSEGAFQNDYLYRRLVFAGIDVNDSLCEDE